MTKAELIEPIIAYEKRDSIRFSFFRSAMRLNKAYLQKVYDKWIQSDDKDAYSWRVAISSEVYFYDKDGKKEQ